MKPKHKVTGCARFFIFFLILLPVVYFGATYARGEDGMQKLKDLYHKVVGKKTSDSLDQNDSGSTYKSEDLQKELNEAKVEIRELKEIIIQKEKEISKLKSAN